MQRKRNPITLLLRIKTGTTILKSDLDLHMGTENGNTIWPSNATLGASNQKTCDRQLQTLYALYSVYWALLIIARIWKQQTCSLLRIRSRKNGIYPQNGILLRNKVKTKCCHLQQNKSSSRELCVVKQIIMTKTTQIFT